MDVRVVGGDQNEKPILAANVRGFERANALVVVQVNASGDIVNPGGSGGGAASNVNINQVGGVATAVNAGNADNGTMRVIIASDQGTIPTTATLTPAVTGVQIVGGGVGGTVGISGDTIVRVDQNGAWSVGVSGDVSSQISDGSDNSIKATVRDYSNSNPVAVVLTNASGDTYNAGGGNSDGTIIDGVDSGIKATVKDYTNSKPLVVTLVNVSGDVYNAGGGGGAASNVNLNQVGGTATSVDAGNSDTGTLRVVIASDQGSIPTTTTLTTPVTGVQIVGGGVGGTVGISGDTVVRADQNGAWSTSVTGDVNVTATALDIRALTASDQVTIAGITQVSGGGSGDIALVDGSDRSIKATVRNYSNSNPISVVLTNASGDSYNAGGGSSNGTIVDGVDNGIIATVKNYANSNPLVVTLVNASGDVYNAGGGAASNVNINQVGGTATSVDAGNSDAGTLRVVIASDQGTIPTTATLTPVVTGVQIVGGGVGGTVGISGDTVIRADQNGAWATAVTGDVNVTATDLDIRNLALMDVVTVGAVTTPIGISGDTGIRDGADPTISATVKNYSNANPLTVVLVNASGDSYNANDTSVSVNKWNLDPSQDAVHVNSGLVGITGDITYLSPTTDSVHINSGLIGITGDRSITDGADNTIAATVKNYSNSNPVTVVLVNASGDAYNANDTSVSVNKWNLDPSQDSLHVNSGLIGVTGDVTTVPKQGETWPVSIAGTQAVAEQGNPGIQVLGGQIGGSVGVTGDVSIRALALTDVITVGNVTVPIGISGDTGIRDGSDPTISATVKNYSNSNPLVVTLANVSGDIYNAGGGGSGSDININQVGGTATATDAGNSDAGTLRVVIASDQAQIPVSASFSPPVTGVQIVGGAVGGTVGVSGDTIIGVNQKGAWAVSVTGDVNVTATALDIRQLTSSDQVSISGTVPVSQSGAWSIASSGDTNLVDGADRTIKSTVRDYTNSNPLTVVNTNTSGDSYGDPTPPLLQTAAGRVTSAGSTSIVSAVSGRRIKVTAFELQGDGSNARGFFANGASGSKLCLEWELAAREGVVRQVEGGRDRGFMFATSPGTALSFESSSSRAMKYSVTYHVEDAS